MCRIGANKRGRVYLSQWIGKLINDTEPAEAMISSNKSLDVVVEANEVCNRTAMARSALVRERISDVICRPTLAILQPLIFMSLLSSREELPNMQGVLEFNTHDRGLFRPYKRTNAKRTKSGCLSCRARHTKCDEHRPICGGCTRNHLLCSWTKANGRAAQLSVSRHERSPQKVPSPPCLNVPSPRYALSHWPRLRGRLNEQSLLRHYIERSAQRLIVRDGIKNPFLTYVLPLAQQNDAFLHIVFAISASHLSYDGQQSHVSALSHYAVALREAKYLITEHGNGTRFNPLELMILLILLCNFEVSYPYAHDMLYYVFLRFTKQTQRICLLTTVLGYGWQYRWCSDAAPPAMFSSASSEQSS